MIIKTESYEDTDKRESNPKKHSNVKNDIISFVENEYPTLTAEFRRLQEEQYAVFCKKHHDYGISNITMGEDVTTKSGKNLAMFAIMVRTRDKIERLKNLFSKMHNPQNESFEDTYMDISVYGIIALIVKNDKWVTD